MNKKTAIQTIGLLLALAVIVMLMPYFWSLSVRINSTQVDPAHAGLEIGADFPRIEGLGWLNEPGLSEADLKGKVVVVHAWADFCPKCHQGMPSLVELHRAYKDKGVVFVGITADASDRVDEDLRAAQLEGARRYVAKYKAQWPIAYGAIDTMLAFKAEYIPGYWVIGRDGKVVYNKASAMTIQQAIERAINAQPEESAESSEPKST